MTMVRRTRFPEYLTLRDAMQHMFDEALLPNAPRAGTNGNGNGNGIGSATVPFDVIDREDEIIVRAPVPGFRTEDLDITVQADVLTVAGELNTQVDSTDEEERYHLREWRSGSFRRAMTLPDQVNAEGAEAEVRDGVLTLRLPKREDVKPRKIEVRTR